MPLGQIQVPFPDFTFPGTPGHQQELSGRIINAYIEPLGPAAPAPAIYRRAPGLRNFGTTVRSGFRGAIEIGGTLYSAWDNRLVRHGASGGAAIDVGVLTGSAKGFFARNARGPVSPTPAAWIASGHAYVIGDFVIAPDALQYRCIVPHNSAALFATDLGAGKWGLYPNGPDIVFCDPTGNYAKWTVGSNTITTNYDPDLPAPNSVTGLDGYFIFTISDGRVFASDFADTNIGALSFANAEAKADGLTRAVAWAGQLFLFGPFTTEVWANAGTTPFPFARVGVVIPRGLAGPYCVSGFEDNFSRALCWVADDNTVVMLNGYTPVKISPPDLDGLIERVADKTTLELSCYISRGHAFLLLSSPTWSWVHDLNTQKWAERTSHLYDRSRITGGVHAFGKWLCGDGKATSQIQEITNRAHTEPPRSQAISGAVAGNAGVIRLTVPVAYDLSAQVIVADVGGTTEANGIWLTSIINNTTIELVGSVFVNAYTSGGTISDAFDQPLRWRLESGAVENFPVGARVGRADFEFVTGVGMTTASEMQAITNVFDSGGAHAHQIRVTITNTARQHDGDAVSIAGVGGTTEANGTWAAEVIDGKTLQLNGSLFANAYTSGGTATLLAPLEPIETDPVIEISWSDDGGQTYYAPIRRKLGRQEQTRELVSLIACTGRSSWNARRWRLDISDPVYVGFMAAYQQLSPKVADVG